MEKIRSAYITKQAAQVGTNFAFGKYFLKTGNTRYGIQNLAYDAFSGNLFACVYNGDKPHFPNYDLFVVDGGKRPVETTILLDQPLKVKELYLLDDGLKDLKTSVNGWYFPWGATGICSLGNGLFYISHNNKTKEGQQETILYKYKWIGDSQKSFELKE